MKLKKDCKTVGTGHCPVLVNKSVLVNKFVKKILKIIQAGRKWNFKKIDCKTLRTGHCPVPTNKFIFLNKPFYTTKVYSN